MRRLALLGIFLAVVVSPIHFAGATTTVSGPVVTDGPAPCSAGDPPFPYHGQCATYNGNNTFYGTYGPGFPTPLGWGLCAHHAAGGGAYPAPGYEYTLSSPVAGSNESSNNSLGWAFSDAQRQGWWEWGKSGTFTATEVAVAAKLLFDHLVWAEPYPTLDAGTTAALYALQALVAEASGMTAAPTVTLALQGGGTTLQTTGTLNVDIVAPGSNKGLSGLPVTLTLSGATFNVNHASTATVTTNASGFAAAAFTTTSLQPSTVKATSDSTIAQPGLLFYGPTAIILNAQVIAGPRAPVAVHNALTLTATGQPTGTLQVEKTGDDPSYLSVADAVFQVLDSAGRVLDTLITSESGLTQVSGPLPVGTYTLHESVPPAGYVAASDVSATVVANTTTRVPIGPDQGDVAERGSIIVEKVDTETNTALAGAVFSVTFDPTDHLRANGTSQTCRTDESGQCTFTDLLPGHYLVTEIDPPPNYLPGAIDQWVHVGPAEVLTLKYSDEAKLIYLDAHKFNADNGNAIPGAVYDLYSKDPGPPTTPPAPPPDVEEFSGYTYQQRGTTDETGQLSFAVRAGYEWCIREVYVPAGYVVDPALHCTGVLTRSALNEFSMPEETSSVQLTVHKFTEGDQSAGIPEAYYALFVRDPFPTGYSAAPTPDGLAVPAGMTLWSIGYTNEHGHLSFTVPSGYQWCVREETAPVDYVLDPALHCTGTLTASSPESSTHVAVAELAYTGAPSYLLPLALLLAVLGLGLRIGAKRIEKR